MTNYLILSIEATDVDPKSANLQFFTMTACQEIERKLELGKERSFFVDNYTRDTLHYVKQAEDNQGFLHTSAYESIISLTSSRAIEIIQMSIEQCDFIIMHAASSYTIPLLQSKGVDFIGKIFIDTSEHLSYNHPSAIKTRKLAYLCAEYNFLLYPENIHLPRTALVNRALIKLINKQPCFETIKQRAFEAFSSLLIAINIKYDQNNRAKELGFTWYPQLKSWAKRGTKEDIELAKNEFGKDNVAIVS